jgi:hypothetical protein
VGIQQTSEGQQQTAYVVPDAEFLPQESASRSNSAEFKGLLEQIIEQSSKEGYARQVVESELSRSLYDQDIKLASVFAQAGCFDDIKGSTPKQSIALAMTKIQLGRSWGLEPADAMRFVYFQGGRPCVESDIIASKLQDSGWDWDIEWTEKKDGDRVICIGCTLWVKRWDAKHEKSSPFLDRAGKPVSVSFTKADADVAMIWEKGKQIPLSEKWNYRSWARDMYFSRSITRVRRYHAPNVMRGAVSRQEVSDVQEGPQETARVAQEFGVTAPLGTKQAAAELAENKIAQMEQERQRKGFLSGETDEDRTKRQEAQFAKDLETAKAAETAKTEPAEKPTLKTEPPPIQFKFLIG